MIFKIAKICKFGKIWESTLVIILKFFGIQPIYELKIGE